MSRRGRVLVVQHEDDCPTGALEAWLRRAGVESDVLRAHEGRALPAALCDHDGLVVLGGAMGAEDDHLHRWLVPTKALITTAVAGGVPFLGVCLGHQLAALALGGQVSRNPTGPTHQLLPFRPTPDGADDPLTSSLAPGCAVLHWNGDVVTRLPEGALALATAPDGTVQAARFGDRAWGVQFHPEVTPEIVRRWTPGPDPERDRGTVRELERRLPELHQAWEGLARRFARVVTGG